jgi:hypothetical protein
MSTLVFISHSHADRPAADALVEYLLAALELEPSSVRCTSVPGHQLPFGRAISEQLKADINSSSAMLVLLTKDSLRSAWVLFELGASWALAKIIVPVLEPSLTPGALPGPLSSHPCVLMGAPDARSRMADAVSQIGEVLRLKHRGGGKQEYKLDTFVERFKSQPEPSPKAEVDEAMAFEIPWLILMIVFRNAKYPASLVPQIKSYMSRLDIAAANPVETQLRVDDDGVAAMNLIAELGGSLVAKVRHDLVPYYEAGANLMPLASRGKRDELRSCSDALSLPKHLQTPGEDLLKWLNAVHDHITAALKADPQSVSRPSSGW